MSKLAEKIILGVLISIISSGILFFLSNIKKWIKKVYFKIKNKYDKLFNSNKSDKLFRLNKSINDFDDLIIYLYKNKEHSVSLSFLKERFDLSEIEIKNRMIKAENKNLVKNYPTFDNEYDWLITKKGEIYVENLLNKNS